MATVYDTAVERIRAFPGLYKSRTDVVLDALVSGRPGWKWINGEAVWSCPEEQVPTIDDEVKFVRETMVNMLPLFKGTVPDTAIDTIAERTRERLLANLEMASFTAQIVNLEAKPPFNEKTFPRSLYTNLPEDLTPDWLEAVNEVKLILEENGHA